MKKKKNMSKLERLKAKIRERKQKKDGGSVVENAASSSNVAMENDTRDKKGEKVDAAKEFAADLAEEKGGERLSKRERRRRQLKEAADAAAATMAKKSGDAQVSGNNDDDEDDLFVPVDKNADSSAANAALEAGGDFDVEETMRRIEDENIATRPLPKFTRLKIGKDGTARVSGTGAFKLDTDKAHQVFDESDSEEEEPTTTTTTTSAGKTSKVSGKKDGKTEKVSAKSQVEEIKDARAAFVERMRKKLETDDKFDQARYKKMKTDKKIERKAKLKKKIKGEQDDAEGGVQDVTLGGGDSGDEEGEWEQPTIDFGDSNENDGDMSDASSCASFGQWQAKKKRKLESAQNVDEDDLEKLALQALQA